MCLVQLGVVIVNFEYSSVDIMCTFNLWEFSFDIVYNLVWQDSIYSKIVLYSSTFNYSVNQV